MSQEQINEIPVSQKYVVYNDQKRYFEKNPIKMKHVFKVWAHQVCQNPYQPPSDLTQNQLENIFPEFAPRLALYHNCCDQTGKIVKNHKYYEIYKSNPHDAGRRGGGRGGPKTTVVKKAVKELDWTVVN